MKLFISVGHSGGKVGAAAWGTTEFSECEMIARSIERALRPLMGENLVMVPTEFDILPRCAFINAQATQNDVAIELHMDSGTGKSTGCGIYYGEEYEHDLAERIIDGYTARIDIPKRFVLPHTKSRFGRLGIIADTKKCTTFLMELGFISSKEELTKMRAESSSSLIAILHAIFVGEKEMVHEVSDFAKASVEKAKLKAIKDFTNPQQLMTDILWQHVFHNLGVLDVVDENNPLTKERVAVILDRLHII